MNIRACQYLNKVKRPKNGEALRSQIYAKAILLRLEKVNSEAAEVLLEVSSNAGLD